jgi:hypothetical protein
MVGTPVLRLLRKDFPVVCAFVTEYAEKTAETRPYRFASHIKGFWTDHRPGPCVSTTKHTINYASVLRTSSTPTISEDD